MWIIGRGTTVRRLLFSFVTKQFLVSNSVPDSVLILALLLWDYDSLRMLPQGHKPHLAISTLCPIISVTCFSLSCRHIACGRWPFNSTRVFGIRSFSGGKTWGPKMKDRYFQHSLLRTEDLAASLITHRNVCNIPMSAGVQGCRWSLPRNVISNVPWISYFVSKTIQYFCPTLYLSSASPVACFTDCTALQYTSSLIAQDWRLQYSWINMIRREIAAPFWDHLKVSEDILSRIPESAFN